MDWSKFEQYGLEGLVICALFYTLYKIINYTMRFIDKSTEQQAKERETWAANNMNTLETIKALQASIQLHNQQSADAHLVLKEAANFQREEHKQMIETLGRINGYTHE
jgi:hypothetical protein